METSPNQPPKFPQRIACLWFPNWPIQRLVVARPELRRQYLVLFQQDPRRGRLVAATSPLAIQAGVRVGMPLSEAKSLLQRATTSNTRAAINHTPAAASNRSGRAQALRFGTNSNYQTTNSNHQTAPAIPPQNPEPFFIFEHDPAADYLALAELADSLSQFSPIVGLEQIDSPAEKNFASSILLEITGLERLFGSEEQLAAELFQFVQDLEYVPRLAIANTLAVAWGASRFGTSRGSIRRKLAADSGPPQNIKPTALADAAEAEMNSVEPEVNAFRRIDPDQCLIIPADDDETFLSLPIESLRLEPPTLDLLHQLGIETNAQLWRLPRAELAMRFGDAIHRRIDQATGKLPEPVVARQTPTEFAATQLLEYPTNHRETIEVIIGRLVEQIGQQLRARQQGGLQWLITMLLVDEPAIRLNLNLFQATATASEIMPLVEMQLEQQLLPKHAKKSWPSHSTHSTHSTPSILKRDDANHTAKVVAKVVGDTPEGSRPTATITRMDENTRSSRCRIQVQEIQVSVTSAVLLVPQQRLLFDEEPQLNRQALTQLINRLTSRLGQQQVVYPQLLSGAQPEYSYRFRPLVDIHRRRRTSGKFAAQSHVVGRPLRIFNPAIEIELEMKHPRDRSFSILCDTMNPSPPAPRPQGGEGRLKPGFPFALEVSPEWHGGPEWHRGPESQSEPTPLPSPPWGRGAAGEGYTLIHSRWRFKDGATFIITQATGPERIETGWWRGPTVCRDYWRVETDTGQSLWIYRDLRKKCWLLQGEF
jgi:protein ImuB